MDVNELPVSISPITNSMINTKRKKCNIYPGNLVPRACDPWEGNEGSGIIRCRKPGILAKIELRIHFNGQSDSSLKRIIPEPSFPSQGSQAWGTRLISWSFSYPKPFLRAVRRGALAKSISGYHKNMVRKQYPVLELANQMPVRNMDLARAPRNTARKKGSGYENDIQAISKLGKGLALVVK